MDNKKSLNKAAGADKPKPGKATNAANVPNEANVDTSVKKIKKEPAIKPAKAKGDAPAEKPVVEKAPAKKAAAPKKTKATNGDIVKAPIPRTAKVVPSATGLKTISFQVRYSTSPGQSLYVCGNHPALGNDDYSQAMPLRFLNNEYWFGVWNVADDAPVSAPVTAPITYTYLLQEADGSFTAEWNDNRVIHAANTATELVLMDVWNAASLIENTFFTEPFKEVLLKDRFTPQQAAKAAKATHVFKIKAPMLQKGQVLCLLGSTAQLGDWNTDQPVLLANAADTNWHIASVDLSEADFPIAYKYGVFDTVNQRFVDFESGNNRVLYEAASPDKQTIVSDGFAGIGYHPFKGAGVAIPVFSLRSNSSFGVGEFTDLKLLVDWARRVGMKLIQLLPINDTTATNSFTDSYPYAAISAFALHPLYLHLPAVAEASNATLVSDAVALQSKLNGLSAVDYEAVMEAKWDIIKAIFPRQKKATFASADFQNFFEENKHWLVSYAVFCYLRDKYKTPAFNEWPKYNQYDEATINRLAGDVTNADEAISIHYFVQYHLHLQLKAATEYAHQNGIIVKGDIPIGIYRNSCDAWQNPSLYNMDMQAGAPPDDFAVKGQNWGFPTYNWQKMREDGFDWWKKRFRQMSYYFDAFRIDHILGFFRIWSIPMHAVEGILGHFVPAVPIHITEFHGRGIYFDYQRLCKPYITGDVLGGLFGADAEAVKGEYLNWLFDDRFELKPEFATQRKIESHFALRENNDYNNRVKAGLYDLVSNVILLEEEGSNGQQFHFRIAAESTTSFQQLDGHTQQQLRELYLDYFFKRQDEFWRKEAMLKLPDLKRSTNMLVCGEDLGMVPASVPGVMRDLAILSLEIQRMPKDPTREFFHPNDAPYLSVVTPSTHDMSTIRGWWEEDRAATQRFFNSELGQWGSAPYFCEPWICRIILTQHFYSPAMWSIFQLQDLLSINGDLRRENPAEERINIPADPRHYWRYRMHLSLEALLQEDAFNNDIQALITQSGR